MLAQLFGVPLDMRGTFVQLVANSRELGDLALQRRMILSELAESFEQSTSIRIDTRDLSAERQCLAGGGLQLLPRVLHGGVDLASGAMPLPHNDRFQHRGNSFEALSHLVQQPLCLLAGTAGVGRQQAKRCLDVGDPACEQRWQIQGGLLDEVMTECRLNQAVDLRQTFGGHRAPRDTGRR